MKFEQWGDRLRYRDHYQGFVFKHKRHRERDIPEDRSADQEVITHKFVEVEIGKGGADLREEIRLHAQPVLFGRFDAQCGEAEHWIVGCCGLLLRFVQRNSAGASTGR